MRLRTAIKVALLFSGACLLNKLAEVVDGDGPSLDARARRFGTKRGHYHPGRDYPTMGPCPGSRPETDEEYEARIRRLELSRLKTRCLVCTAELGEWHYSTCDLPLGMCRRVGCVLGSGHGGPHTFDP